MKLRNYILAGLGLCTLTLFGTILVVVAGAIGGWIGLALYRTGNPTSTYAPR